MSVRIPRKEVVARNAFHENKAIIHNKPSLSVDRDICLNCAEKTCKGDCAIARQARINRNGKKGL